jgi:hypothetical protein
MTARIIGLASRRPAPQPTLSDQILAWLDHLESLGFDVLGTMKMNRKTMRQFVRKADCWYVLGRLARFRPGAPAWLILWEVQNLEGLLAALAPLMIFR